jgi:hypothetical protein
MSKGRRGEEATRLGAKYHTFDHELIPIPNSNILIILLGMHRSAKDDVPKAAKEWNAPKWTRGLIVKPDQEHVKGQIRLWGMVTAIGAALPPAQDYLGRFTWLICVAQLTFRGMPKEDREGGGMGMSFNSGGSGGGGHRKATFALGFTTWVFGAILAYGMMPTWARGQQWTGTVAFALQNLIFGLASCYLQPYKG